MKHTMKLEDQNEEMLEMLKSSVNLVEYMWKYEEIMELIQRIEGEKNG